MESIFVFLDITKIGDFRWKDDDVSRLQRMLTFLIFFRWGVTESTFITAGYV